MSDVSKNHTTLEEKIKWETSSTNIDNHVDNNRIHVPVPPTNGNFYLASDGTWKRDGGN